MKRYHNAFLLLCLMLLFPASDLIAQHQTIVELSDQSNEVLRQKMSNNATKLITLLNTSFYNNTTPSLSDIDMTNEARQNVLQIWEHSPFRCLDTEVITRCLNTNKGFQIRNLPFIVKEGNENQDVVINFLPSGKIESFYFAIENHKYQSIIKANKSVTDLRRRQMILDFIENFRTAYNRKDLPLIESMYSDDVLIITGQVYKATGDKMTGMDEEKVKYNKQTKSEYMTRLKRVFANNKYVNIGFDDISVLQHPVDNNIYGVTLRQAWRTSNYSDDGWLFLAVEFHSETDILIHVRTWQPYMLNGKVFPRNEVFQLGEFEF